MHLEIVTPEKTLFEGKVELIQVPGSKGQFQVLQYHAPIISTLEKGTIRVEESTGNPQYFDIEGGIIEVQRNKTIILAEVA
ncbi:MAG: ATP synthase F1 subunit epsilon [Bacteroidales bacterium]|nr:ATP synthase F1 subunit epsilon [Bacteroidales bacterium]MBS3775155.1 ATP synthase F1 subunit epsilon [Bacteroidales bacterium]